MRPEAGARLSSLGCREYQVTNKNMWYDKEGKPLLSTNDTSDPKWIEEIGGVEKLLSNPDYKIIKQETLPNGKFVSTVWLGLDHSLTGEAPLIFETMVFSEKGKWDELDMERYATLEEARKGHDEMVKEHNQ